MKKILIILMVFLLSLCIVNADLNMGSKRSIVCDGINGDVVRVCFGKESYSFTMAPGHCTFSSGAGMCNPDFICYSDSDCMIDTKVCSNTGNVYNVDIGFVNPFPFIGKGDEVCTNPGTAQSRCDLFSNRLNILIELVEECEYGCLGGECIPSCYIDSDCGDSIPIDEPYCRNRRGIYQDFTEFTCINPGTLDSYCENKTTTHLIEKCEYGCIYQTCLPKPPCIDPDGGDYFTRGTLEYHDQEYTDFCTGSALTEYFCYRNQNQSYYDGYFSRNYQCMLGCANGACLTSGICTDQDGGLNYNVRAGLIDTTGSMYTDYCKNSVTLVEYSCGLDNFAQTTEHRCRSNEICENGGCKCYRKPCSQKPFS